MNIITNFIDILIAIGNFLWSGPVVVGLLLTAIVYTVGTKGFQFTHFGYALKETFGKRVLGNKNSKKGISSFKAFCTALCNTLGMGNIAGMGIAIGLGGPGAIFWVWVSVLLAMIIKYGEIMLGVKYREIDPETGMYRGGLMWYVEKGLGRRWKWIAILYALIYVITVLNGPALQINSVTVIMVEYIDVPPVIIGLIAAVAMALVLLGGMIRLSSFAEKMVPFMAILYIAGTVFVLWRCASLIPDALALIVRSAFSDVRALPSGFGGATVMMAMRYGVARGFFSNGSGCGDAPFVHSSADVKHPGEQAIWGISEVFVDGIICTCTAIVIIVTGAWQTDKIGASLTSEAFARGFGSELIGGVFLSIVIAAFAFTTAIVGVYIGETCLKYFVNNKTLCLIYRTLLCCSAVVGSNEIFMEKLDKLWLIADFNSGVSTLLSLLTLLLLSRKVFDSTKEYKEMIRKNNYQYNSD